VVETKTESEIFGMIDAEPSTAEEEVKGSDEIDAVRIAAASLVRAFPRERPTRRTPSIAPSEVRARCREF